MDRQKAAERLVDFLVVAEGLKRELRHSWLSDGRRESVAEHTWLMALMALLTHRRLETPVRLERALALILVHDLAEALTGDVPYFEAGDRKAAKAAREAEAMARIRALLPAPEGAETFALWQEFEEGRTPEARLARALDHLEVQAQHNLADLSTWEPVEHELVYTKMDDRCAHDAFLQALCVAVRQRAESKLRSGGVDVEAVKARIRSGANS